MSRVVSEPGVSMPVAMSLIFVVPRGHYLDYVRIALHVIRAMDFDLDFGVMVVLRNSLCSRSWKMVAA